MNQLPFIYSMTDCRSIYTDVLLFLYFLCIIVFNTILGNNAMRVKKDKEFWQHPLCSVPSEDIPKALHDKLINTMYAAILY